MRISLLFVNNRIDEEHSVAAKTEVRNLEKYFPVVRILTAGSRSLIGVGRRNLKSEKLQKTGKANTVCCCLQQCELWTRVNMSLETLPFKQHHINCVAKHNKKSTKQTLFYCGLRKQRWVNFHSDSSLWILPIPCLSLIVGVRE